MILKSIKNKNTKDAIILIVLFVLYWFFVFLQSYFVNSFLNPVFSSVFWHMFMSMLGFIAILSPLLIIANAIRGPVESSPGFKKYISKKDIIDGVVFLIVVFLYFYVMFTVIR